MARESFIKEMENGKSNAFVRAKEHFGWELINTQNVLETGLTVLTFTREKSKVWYKTAVDLERRYWNAAHQIDRLQDPARYNRKSINTFLLILLLLLGIIPGIFYALSVSNHNKHLASESQQKNVYNQDAIRKLRIDQQDILMAADAAINTPWSLKY